MKKLYLVLTSFFALLLISCNGHNEDNTQKKPYVVATIELLLLDSEGNLKQSFAKNEVITMQAKVYDKNRALVTNKAVSFSAPIGTLSLTSKLTDSNGLAIVYITNNSLSLGAGTAIANVGEISSQGIDYEFIESDAADATPNLTTVMTLDSESVNQFKTTEEVQITSTLTDTDGQGVANKIITFTADIGTFSTTSALTNSQGVASVNLSSGDSTIGAGVLTSSYVVDKNTNINISNTFNYQILSTDAAIESNIRLGYFDENDNFIEGKIELSIENKNISAGGTLGLSVDLVDGNNNLITTPIPVTFTSNCVQNGNASIDESVLSINGTASSTFADIDCAGVTGTDDVIVASVSVNNITNTANETITIGGEQLGSIEFISAEPTSIVLKGTGGQDKQETSTLTFKVKSQLGNVLAQQEVNFTLSTSVGGINLSRTSGFTNSQGLVTTQVSAGTVPTPVRVTASASMDFNNETVTVQSQSDLLSINTGLPDQRSMSISASVLNPEAHTRFDATSVITVSLSDSFHNPVPDGTTVNFTTEGGTIEPSCVTTNGNCSVTWTSSEPRVEDHRVTILATALGHETFFDTNGNNIFDTADGEAIIDIATSTNFNIDSGFDNYPAQSSGFLDMSEAWRDDNENSVYDNGETFLDFNNNEDFSNADKKFNGPQCQGGLCAIEDMRSIHVRKAMVLVMASSDAVFTLTNSDDKDSVIYQSSLTGVSLQLADIPDISNGGSQAFNFSFADTSVQTMPFGTTVSITLSAGSLQGDTSFTVGNNNQADFSHMSFSVKQETGSSPEIAILTITITTPSGYITSINRSMELL
ncbi:MAG: Ig-like domain-containing protein [Colwellia sp.]|nr:Ig-like domain-containing protein [Colwellia sp.]